APAAPGPRVGPRRCPAGSPAAAPAPRWRRVAAAAGPTAPHARPARPAGTAKRARPPEPAAVACRKRAAAAGVRRDRTVAGVPAAGSALRRGGAVDRTAGPTAPPPERTRPRPARREQE